VHGIATAALALLQLGIVREESIPVRQPEVDLPNVRRGRTICEFTLLGLATAIIVR